MKRSIIAIVAAAFVLRLLAPVPVPSGDALYYIQIAESIASGHGMVGKTPNQIGPLMALFPPLYPLLLAVFPVFLLNFAIDLAGAASIIWLGRGSPASRVAAAVYLLWPFSILAAPVAHKEGLVALLAVLCACTARDRQPILFGACAGLLALTQPALVPLAGLFALAFLPWRIWHLAAAAAAIVMLPWWVRNWIVLGEFVPLTTSTGLAVYVAVFGDGSKWVPLAPELRHYSEIETSRAALGASWEMIKSGPLDYVLRCGTKTLRQLALFPLMPAIAAALMVKGDLRKMVILCLASLFLFQMWFQLAPRHLFHLTPFLLLMLAEACRQAMTSIENHDRSSSMVTEVSLSEIRNSSK